MAATENEEQQRDYAPGEGDRLADMARRDRELAQEPDEWRRERGARIVIAVHVQDGKSLAYAAELAGLSLDEAEDVVAQHRSELEERVKARKARTKAREAAQRIDLKGPLEERKRRIRAAFDKAS